MPETRSERTRKFQARQEKGETKRVHGTRPTLPGRVASPSPGDTRHAATSDDDFQSNDVPWLARWKSLPGTVTMPSSGPLNWERRRGALIHGSQPAHRGFLDSKPRCYATGPLSKGFALSPHLLRLRFISLFLFL